MTCLKDPMTQEGALNKTSKQDDDGLCRMNKGNIIQEEHNEDEEGNCFPVDIERFYTSAVRWWQLSCNLAEIISFFEFHYLKHPGRSMLDSAVLVWRLTR